MSRAEAQRLTWYIAGVGALATALLFARFGREQGTSAAIGVVVALANWYSLRFIVARVIEGSMRRKAVFAVLLSVKMAALLGLCFLLIHLRFVRLEGFSAGVSALVAGTLLGSFVHILGRTPAASES